MGQSLKTVKVMLLILALFFLGLFVFRSEWQISIAWGFEVEINGEVQSSIEPPVTIEAEDFDQGGEGVAYHDTTHGNAGLCGGSGYRLDESVDIYPNDPAEGCHVGGTKTGEWTAYTHDFPSSGRYEINLFVCGKYENTVGRLYVDGVAVASFAVPQKTTWHEWEPVALEIYFNAGSHVIRIEQGDTIFTFDKMTIGRVIDGLQAVDLVTFFGSTGQPIKVSWDHNEPLPDFYQVELYSVERKTGAVITPEGGVTENSFVFTLPRSGHYIAKVRACLGVCESPPCCGDWSESTDPEVAIVNGQPRGWWLYGYVAPAGAIDITREP